MDNNEEVQENAKEDKVFDWERESRTQKGIEAKKSGDDTYIPDEWYCNAALILRGKKKDIELLVQKIIPEMTACEETDFDIKVVYVRMSHGRFDVIPENGSLPWRLPYMAEHVSEEGK